MYDDDEEQTVPCPVCGVEVYEDSPRCPGCGEYITSSTFRRKKYPTWFYVLMGIILILTILSFVMPMF